MMYIENGELKHIDDDILIHYGVPGMKWGVRKRIQDTYNNIRSSKAVKGVQQVGTKIKRAHASRQHGSRNTQTQSKTEMTPEQVRKQKAARAVKVGAAVAATVVAVYGVKKLNDWSRQVGAERHRKEIERIQRLHDLSYQRYWLSQNGYTKPRR